MFLPNDTIFTNSMKLRVSYQYQCSQLIFKVRLLRHSNINSLIGACVEPNKVCIVYGYCGKGSLRDVLQSRHITMDRIFATAFSSDIIHVSCWKLLSKPKIFFIFMYCKLYICHYIIFVIITITIFIF